jgi:hypothetical protein
MMTRSLSFCAAAGLSLVLALPVEPAQVRTVKVKVPAEQANLLEKPDIGSAVVQQIPEGTVLESDRKEGEWYLVRYTLDDGGTIAGYIHESLVVVLDGSPARPARPETARKPEAAPKPPRDEWPAAGTGRRGADNLFDIFLSAGGGDVGADDFNQGAQGLVDTNAALLGLEPSGSVGRLRLACLLGAEVFYRVNARVSVGLGLDAMAGRNSSFIAQGESGLPLVSPGTFTRPGLAAMPVKAGLRFYPRPDIYIRGSVVYYSARAGYDYRFVAEDLSSETWQGRATAHTLGMEIAIGGEWRIGGHMDLFSEAGFRLAKLDNFSGTGTYRDSTGTTVTETGSLWTYRAVGADDASHDLLFIHSSAPSGDGISGARKAELNLSGIVLRVGIKFRI